MVVSPHAFFTGSCGFLIKGDVTIDGLEFLNFSENAVCVDGMYGTVHSSWFTNNKRGVLIYSDAKGVYIDSNVFSYNESPIFAQGYAGSFMSNLFYENSSIPITRVQQAFPESDIPIVTLIDIPGDVSESLKFTVKVNGPMEKVSFIQAYVADGDDTLIGRNILPLYSSKLTQEVDYENSEITYSIPVDELQSILPGWKTVTALVHYFDVAQADGYEYTTMFLPVKKPELFKYQTDMGCDMSLIDPVKIPDFIKDVAQEMMKCVVLKPTGDVKVIYWSLPSKGSQILKLSNEIVIKNDGPPLEIWGGMPWVSLPSGQWPKVRFWRAHDFTGAAAIRTQGNVLLANLAFEGFKDETAIFITKDGPTGSTKNVTLVNDYFVSNENGVAVGHYFENVNIINSHFQKNGLPIWSDGKSVMIKNNRYSGNEGVPITLGSQPKGSYPAPVFTSGPAYDPVGDYMIDFKFAYADQGDAPIKVHLYVSGKDDSLVDTRIMAIPESSYYCYGVSLSNEVACQISQNYLDATFQELGTNQIWWKSLAATFEYAGGAISEFSEAKVPVDKNGCNMAHLTATQIPAKIQSVAASTTECLVPDGSIKKLYWMSPVDMFPVVLSEPIVIQNADGPSLQISGTHNGVTLDYPVLQFVRDAEFSGQSGFIVGNNVEINNIRVEGFDTGVGVEVVADNVVLKNITYEHNNYGVKVLDSANHVLIAGSLFNENSYSVKVEGNAVALMGNDYDSQLMGTVVLNEGLKANNGTPIIDKISFVDSGDVAYFYVQFRCDLIKGWKNTQALASSSPNSITGSLKAVAVPTHSCTPVHATNTVYCKIDVPTVLERMPDPKGLSISVTYSDGQGSEFSSVLGLPTPDVPVVQPENAPPAGSGPDDPAPDDPGPDEPVPDDDLDDDGVLNNVDACADTPAGEGVNDLGCSCSQLELPAVTCPEDTCHDGKWYDYPLGGESCKDGEPVSVDCTATISETEECQAGGDEEDDDLDDDSVLNINDTCADTPAGEDVNANGCSCSQISVPMTYCPPDQCVGGQLLDYPDSGLGTCNDGVVTMHVCTPQLKVSGECALIEEQKKSIGGDEADDEASVLEEKLEKLKADGKIDEITSDQVKEAIEAGITIQKLVEYGVPLALLTEYGISIQELLDAGVTVDQLTASGITVPEEFIRQARVESGAKSGGCSLILN